MKLPSSLTVSDWIAKKSGVPTNLFPSPTTTLTIKNGNDQAVFTWQDGSTPPNNCSMTLHWNEKSGKYQGEGATTIMIGSSPIIVKRVSMSINENGVWIGRLTDRATDDLTPNMGTFVAQASTGGTGPCLPDTGKGRPAEGFGGREAAS